MSRRRILGQHTLIDPLVIEAVVKAADLKGDEVVYEIGTGSGVLTDKLCRLAGVVISSEIDERLYIAALSSLNHPNLILIRGDGFEIDVNFDVFVSSLPYHFSAKFVRWLLSKRFKRAVVLLQKDFVDKLLAKVGCEYYRAVSALAQYALNVSPILTVSPNAFTPRPKVQSSLVVITPKHNAELSEEIKRTVYKLFAFRKKKVSTALKILKKNAALNYPLLPPDLLTKRVAALTPAEVVKLAEILVDHFG